MQLQSDLSRHAAPAAITALRSAAATAQAAAKTHRFLRDEIIHAEGDPVTHWYELVSGIVRVSKLTPDGRRQIINILLPGDVFGFDGWGVHATSAEAVSDEGAVVRKRCRKRLEAMADESPEVARRVRQFTAEGLARAHERLLILGRRTASERVAIFLLEMEQRLASQHGGRGGRGEWITLPMSRTDIADYLGLTMETVSRTIGALHRAGLIDMQNTHRVRIANRAGLLAEAGQDTTECASLDALGTLSMHIVSEAA